MINPIGGTVEPGQVVSLTRRSAWRRDYDMRAGERALGWLRWQPGRRSFAQAEGRGIGLIDLATRRRRVVVARAGAAEPLATVERGRGGSVIHTVEGRALRWEKTARGNRWAMRDQDGPCSSSPPSKARYGPRLRSAWSGPCPNKPRCCCA